MTFPFIDQAIALIHHGARNGNLRQLTLSPLARSPDKVVMIPKMKRPYNIAFTINANDIVLPYQFKASRKTPKPL